MSALSQLPPMPPMRPQMEGKTHNVPRFGMPSTSLAARPNVQPVDTCAAFIKQQGKRSTNTAESNALSPAWGGVEPPTGWVFSFVYTPRANYSSFVFFHLAWNVIGCTKPFCFPAVAFLCAQLHKNQGVKREVSAEERMR